MENLILEGGSAVDGRRILQSEVPTILDKVEDQIDDIIDDRLENIDTTTNLKWNEVQ